MRKRLVSSGLATVLTAVLAVGSLAGCGSDRTRLGRRI